MTSWAPQVFAPFPQAQGILFARVAARSAAFEGTSAAGGAPVLVGSAAGHDRDQVVLGARGELLERLGNVMAGRAAEAAAEVVGTRAELRRRGMAVAEPRSQASANADADADADPRRLWVRGRTTRGAEVFVPAAEAFLHHRPPSGCEVEESAGSTGIAAHPDLDSAVRHAAWEVLERDLVRRSWYGLAGRPPSHLPFTAPPPLAGYLGPAGLTATAFNVPAPAGTACAVVCLHRPDGTGQTFGARCGPADALGALAEKAAYEALMVRWSMETQVAQRAWSQWRGARPPATAVEHALWAFHRQDSLRLWDVRQDPQASPEAISREGVRGNPLDVLAGHTGQDVILVETTSPPARDAGVRVVRVLAPGALPLPSGGGAGRPHPFG